MLYGGWVYPNAKAFGYGEHVSLKTKVVHASSVSRVWRTLSACLEFGARFQRVRYKISQNRKSPSAICGDPRGASSGADRVLRGGSWSNSASSCRSANRYWSTPDYRYYYLGFRLAHRPVQ